MNEKDSVDMLDGYTAEGIGFRGLSREATDVRINFGV